jgi:hypothetical protein
MDVNERYTPEQTYRKSGKIVLGGSSRRRIRLKAPGFLIVSTKCPQVPRKISALSGRRF